MPEEMPKEEQPADLTDKTIDADEPEASKGRAVMNPHQLGRKVKMGMPAAGGAHEPGADIALGAAGMRSGIEKSGEAGKLLDFVKKYGEHYDGDPNVLEKQISQMDSLGSEQVAMRLASINHMIGKLHSKARKDMKRRLEEKMWGQYFPKHDKDELRSLVRKAKGSTRYENDPIAREKIDKVQQSLYDFDEKLNQVSETDPAMKKLDDDYTLVVGGRNAASNFGKALSTTTKAGETGDKSISKIHQKYRPVFANKGDKEPTGYSKVGEPVTVPKPRMFR